MAASGCVVSAPRIMAATPPADVPASASFLGAWSPRSSEVCVVCPAIVVAVMSSINLRDRCLQKLKLCRYHAPVLFRLLLQRGCPWSHHL
ncbi:unnamed protein product [Lampetra fluviatilis]